MKRDQMRKKLTRIASGLLIMAMLVSDSSVVVLAADTPEDPIPVINEIEPVSDPVPGGDTQTPAEPASDPATDPVADPTTDPATDPSADPEADHTTDPVTDPETAANPNATTSSQEPEEEEPVLFKTVVIEEAHGEVGRLMSNRFNAFADDSRSDYYRRYYNQLGEYGKQIYSYLVDHSQDFIDVSQNPTQKDTKLPKLILEEDIPGSRISSCANEAVSQVYYAYAAFDYDHPEVFWLAANNFEFNVYTQLAATGNTSKVMIDFAHAEGKNYTIYADDELGSIASDKTAMESKANAIKTSANPKTEIKEKVEVINDELSNYNYYNRYVSKRRDSEASPKAYKSVSALTSQNWLTSSDDLGDNTAPVCEAYSRAFKIVCDLVGIPCVLVSGDHHMWNYVQNDDGVWYAVDVTWDDPVRTDEYTNHTTPPDAIHKYVMVGSGTVVEGETKSFREDGHHPNGTFWSGGRVMPTPEISTTAYESGLGPVIRDLNVTADNGKTVITYRTNKPGKYYYIMREYSASDTFVPSVYDVQNLDTTVDENGSGTGTASPDEDGVVRIEVENPPEGKQYKVYLIQLTREEYISNMLTAGPYSPLAYVGWKTINGKKYYFCDEDYDGWVWNYDQNGAYENPRGAMAVGGIWIDNCLWKFKQDGTLEKLWYRISRLNISPIPADAPGAVAENILQRGSAYKLVHNYVPEITTASVDELTDNKAITWTSSDPRTVSVDKDGTIHALKVSDSAVTITGETGDDDNWLGTEGNVKKHPYGAISVRVTYPVGWFSVGADRFYGESDGTTVTLATGWKDIGLNKYYFYPADDTVHTPYSAATGYARIDGRYYEFDADGALVGGTQLSDGFVVLDGKTYYVVNGALVTDQNRMIGDHYYGFDSEGVMYQDKYFTRTEGGNTWYFYADEDGVLATGPRYTNLEGNRYFADAAYAAGHSVPIGSMQKGIITLSSGSYYYSDISSTIGSGGELIVNGGLRQYGYFAGDGANTGKHYYALPYGNANAGMLQTGWVKIDNTTWKMFRAADAETDPFAETQDAYLNGWVEVTESGTYKRYYIDSNGRRRNGWQTINGKRYFFNPDGSVCSGLCVILNNTYYFGQTAHFGYDDDDYGIMKTGRVQASSSETFFFNTNGIRQSGWQKDPTLQTWDYYDPTTFGSYNTDPNTAPNDSLNSQYWYRMTEETDISYYYYRSNNSRVTGWQTIDGGRYWFDTTAGILHGRMVTGLRKIGNDLFFFSENGADKGKVLTGLCTYDSHTYYANGNGVLQLGWQKIDGRWRYFDRSYGYETTATIDQDYWCTVTGTDGATTYKYYFRNGTSMVTGRQLIDGRYYYFSENKNDGSLGRLLIDGYARAGNNLYHAAATTGILELVTTGWIQIDGRWKYIDTNNNLRTGWQTIDGKRYYFDADANMVTGQFNIGATVYRTHEGEAGYDDHLAGACYINEWYSYYNSNDTDTTARRWQYFNSNGARCTGWLGLNVNGKTQYYYLSPNASADNRYGVGDMYTGVNMIGNNRYVFDRNGINVRNGFVTLEADAVSRIIAGDAGTYYSNNGGVMLTGWQKIDSKWRYFDTATGKEAAATNSGGFLNVGTDTYYFADGSRMQTGFKDIDGKRYFFFNDSRDQANYGKMAKGWFFVGNDKYYADTDGHLLYGYVSIDNHNYIFNSRYILQTGWQVIDTNGTDRRFFDNSIDKNDPLYGAQLTSAYVRNGYYSTEIDGETYYYRFVNGNMQKGWQTIDGGRYCFGNDGRLQIGLFNFNRNWFYTSETGAVGGELGRIVPGIVTLDSGNIRRTYYFNASGQMMKGWQRIDNQYYYFDPTESDNVGAMVYGRFKVGSQYFYTDPNGIRQTNRFINYCGETYYANGSGVLVSGWQNLRYTTDNITRRYYFDSEGRMLTGWQKISNAWYFFNTDTDLPQKGSLATGNTEIGGETYCFNNNGVMLTGWQNINGTWCYFAGETDLQKEYITDAQLGKRIYTETAVPADFWRQVEFPTGTTRWYYISNNRSVCKGWNNVRDALGVTRRYYFDPVTGELITGFNKIGNAYYILPDKGQNIDLLAGRQLIGSDHYFFNRQGQAITGWQRDTDNKYYYYAPADCKENHGVVIGTRDSVDVHAIKIGNNYYRLADDGSRFPAAFINGYMTVADGRLLVGWQTVREGNVNYRYYFDTVDCHMYRNESRKIGSSWYTFDDDGKMLTGFVNEGGHIYYYNGSGVRLSGWQTIRENNVNNRFYFDPAGGVNDPAMGRMVTGFKTISNNRYYFNSNGIMQTGFQPDINGEKYVFNNSGVMQTGWQRINNLWYYFATPNDVKLGRVEADKVGKCQNDTEDGFWRTVTFDHNQTCKYYIRNNSSVCRGWQTIDNKRYYFNDFFELMTGSFAVGNVRYYADADGAAHNGFVYNLDGDGSWHFYDAGGRMLTGWQNIKGSDNVTRRYFFNANGVLYIGKKSLNGTYYFFNDDASHNPGEGEQGRMMTGPVTASDGNYFANSGGVLQTGWQKIDGNWDYYARQEDINSGLADPSEFGKQFYHEDAAPTTFWRNVHFNNGETRDYYINNNKTVLRGWQNIKNAANVTIRYYFDPTTGELWTGRRKIGNAWFVLPNIDERLTFGWFDDGGSRYYLNANGQYLTGWQTIRENNVNNRYYFDPTIGAMQTGLTAVGNSWYYFGDNGIMRIGPQEIGGHLYCFNNGGVMLTGWQNVRIENVNYRYYFNPSPGTDFGRKMSNGFVTAGNNTYYLDETGIMRTNCWIYDNSDMYYFNNSGVMVKGWLTLNEGGVNHRYYLDPSTGKRQANCIVVVGGNRFFFDGDGVMQTGKVRISELVPGSAGNGDYYFNGNGAMLYGWQTIREGNVNNRYYFSPYSGKMATGFLTVDNNRYYLGEDGILRTGLVENIGTDNDTYFFNNSGVAQMGWQKINNVWHYFATVDDVSLGRVAADKRGKECSNAITPAGSFWRTVTFDQGQGTAVFYINNNNNLLKGWQNIRTGDVTKRYYFSPAGELTYGHFVVGNVKYYANVDGAYPGSIISGFVDDNDGNTYYYNANGAMLTGWQDITENGTRNRYYFDFDGKMQTGKITVSSRRYLLNNDTALGTVGILLRGNYYVMSGHKYMTNNNGELLTGWQRTTAGNVTTLRYFDPETGEEANQITVTSATGWYEDTNHDKFYLERGAVSTGWRTINGKRYYFEPGTGKMAKGQVKISGVLYYFDDNGVLGTGVTNSGGKYYFLNSNGTVRVGWITDGGKKYYVDPSTGQMSIGFATIGGSNYYFNEEASKAGQLVTGFFRVPDMGQRYYDSTPNASNLYYALPDGRLHESGWDTIILNPKVSDSQRWAYYFAPNVVGKTKEGYDITGEVATGDVLIDADDGTVTPLGTVADLGTSSYVTDDAHFYRFDKETGARRKAVLVFMGNYYGEADCELIMDNETITGATVTPRFSKEQYDVIGSIGRYINPDTLFVSEAPDFFIVNSARSTDQQKLYAAGLTRYNPANTTFPMAASKKQDYISPRDKEHYMYVAGNDIASGDGVAGQDEHVDVYDVKMYSTDVYNRAINKYGINNLVLIGVSSGGGLCLSLCQQAAANKQPAQTILLSPWVNLDMDKAEIERQIPPSSSAFLDVDTARYWAARYTRDFDDPQLYSLPNATNINWTLEGPGVGYKFASPLKAEQSQFEKLHDVIIYTGSYDPLSIDCKKAADKSGGRIELKNYPSMIHGYMFVKSSLSQSKETIRQTCWKITSQ